MVYAAILAGGRGTRMGGALPKQYLELCGTPILIHTVRAFLACPAVDTVLLCVPSDYIGYTRQILLGYPDTARETARIAVTAGGDDRTGSLENACRFFEANAVITPEDILMTHDCVRPFVTNDMILDSIQKARDAGGATAAVPCVDTICVSRGGQWIDDVPDRSTLYSVQTPQTFRMTEFCEKLYSLTPGERERVTDASAVLRLRNAPVALSLGSPSNIKITHPDDIPTGEAILSARRPTDEKN